MKRNNIIKSILFTGTLVLGVSCTNLNEQILDGAPLGSSAGGTIDTKGFLVQAYQGLRGFETQGQMFTMNEMSTDAMVGPTRGGDWDDNAKWRQIHTHTWAPDHSEIINAWNALLSQVYNCNLVIDNGSGQDVAEARFLRAFYYYNVVDLFGQAPYREKGSLLTADPKVWTRTQATEFCISELEAVVGSLPTRTAGDASIANQDAAHFLLAKLYLNKAVFEATTPGGPYTFAAADMNKVVTNVDAISSSLAPDYWDNFKPTNNTSPEILFSGKNIEGGAGGGISYHWFMGSHYNQTPSGWNGFATLAEYYNKFDPADRRIHNADPGIIQAFGNPAGFQIGQMYGPGGTTPLLDRIKTTANPNGQPLVYTKAITLITSGATLESAGVRPEKYIPDAVNLNNPDNDYVFMRYSDALLMKAEAVVRGGSGSVGTIMTDIAARAGQTASPATLDGIYLERAKELWYEGWRRNDMIRFGTFLNARELKPYVSDKKYLLFSIPADALFNSNLKQNPGY